MPLASLAATGRALAASLALFAKLAAADSRFAGHCSYGYYTAHPVLTDFAIGILNAS